MNPIRQVRNDSCITVTVRSFIGKYRYSYTCNLHGFFFCSFVNHIHVAHQYCIFTYFNYKDVLCCFRSTFEQLSFIRQTVVSVN
jgi:hypothetical protein